MKNSEWSDIASLEGAARALRLCSAGLLYPDLAWREKLEGLLKSSEGTLSLQETFRRQRLEELQAEHFRLFGSAPACPLEIAWHLSENPFEQTKILSQVSAFHKAFGVDSRDGVRPDNLSVGLEFLSYLILKYLNAVEKGLADGREVTREAALSYAREFLVPGLGAFLEKLRAHPQGGFYAEISGLGLRELERIFPGARSSASRWDKSREDDLAEKWKEGSCGPCPL